MSKNIRWRMACIPALLVLCSCTRFPEQTKSDTPPAQIESKTESEPTKQKASPDEEAQLVARWNATAGQGALNLRGFEATNFRWESFDQFPHPTYKGGSDAAYANFRTRLVAFLQHGDNFDYLATNRLFTVELRHVFEGGHVGTRTTFAKLVSDMSRPGDKSDDDTRMALRAFAERIEANLKK